MKNILLLFLVFTASTLALSAQTADEIIATYLENIGGVENLAKIKSTTSKCSAKAQGMDLPVTMYNAEGGKSRMDLVFQGKEITQFSFDGKEGWTTNFMTMEAEKMESEESMIQASKSEFPDAFYNYKENGYTVSLEGEEEVEGTACFIVKLTRKPITLDGKEVANEVTYYFDKDSSVPIMSKEYMLTGEMKGMSTETYYSDYEEVEGVYFPLTISQKFNGQPVFDVTIDELLINQEIAGDFFDFPVKKAEDDKIELEKKEVTTPKKG